MMVYQWFRHLFYLLGFMYLCFLRLDLEAATDTFQFIKIHFTYREFTYEQMSVSKMQRIKNFLTAALGFVITLVLIWLVVGLIKWLIHF